MRRLFLKIYAVLGLVVVLSIVLAGFLRASPEPWAGPLTLFSGFPAAATRELAHAETHDQQQVAIDTLSERFGYGVHMLPRQAAEASMVERDRQTLIRGEPVTELTSDGATLTVPLAGQPFVVTLGPVPPPSVSISPWVILLLSALIVVAGAAGLLLVPLQRHLSALASAADAFGMGELHARALVPPSSAAGGLAHSFNAMADHVRDLIQGRQELLNAVSHELRGPLQRVRFAVELLEDVPDGDELKARVRDIQGDVDELDTLVEELLTWSRLQGGAGTLHHESVEIRPALHGLADTTRRLRPDKSVQLTIGPVPDSITADPRQLHRALTNLCNNAARYAKTSVRISAQPIKDGMQICVDDDGPGVPDALRDRIFEPFVRLDEARSRDKGGIGLGLSIARRIADAHGATLSVERSDMGGARFIWRMAGSWSGRDGSIRDSSVAASRRGSMPTHH